jgi:DNA-binding NtrC family response regulator
MCDIKRAETYTEAENLLLNEEFDIAILDIMGVGGYKLLELSKQKDVMPVMLTANAFSMADTMISFQKGAASYIPKERMDNITLYLNDILEAKEQGLHSWRRWLDRFADLYAKKFTPNWKEKDKEFWDKLQYHI